MNLQLVAVGKPDHPLNELRPATGQLRPVVQIDDQLANVSKESFPILPPLFEAINQEVAGFAGGAEDDCHHSSENLQDTERNQLPLDVQVLVLSFHRFPAAGRAATRQFTQLEDGFGVDLEIRSETGRSSEGALCRDRVA